MNENATIFRTGWDAVSQNKQNFLRKLHRPSAKTRAAYHQMAQELKALPYHQRSLTMQETINNGLSLQLNLFNDYVTSKDIRK